MDHLEDHANAYLKHKFPKWNPGEEIPAQAYSKLNKTELAKVNFTVNVLNAIKDQKEVEKDFNSIVKESKEADIKFEDIPEKEENGVDLGQVAFQNQLKEDTDLEKDSSLISSSEDIKEFNLIKDDSIEEEKLDEPLMSNHQ